MTSDELPLRAYTDVAYYERELERVFRATWLPLARTAELGRPGAFRALEVAGSPLVLLRDPSGAARAFHNVCPHRGAQILREERGCVQELYCPYHAYRFALDGRLSHAPEIAKLDAAAVKALDLAPVACAEHAGWVWIHLGENPEPLDSFLRAAEGELARWPLATLETKEHREIEGDFGWKLGVEAFLESLHVPAIHPRTASPFVDVGAARLFELGEHSGMSLPFRDLQIWTTGPLGEIARAAGVEPFAGLDEEQTSHHLVYLLFPATILMIFPNHLLALTFLPLAVDRSRLVFELLAEPATSAAAEAWYEGLRPGYAELVREDLENLPWIQKGLAGGSLERYTLADLETRIASFRRALAARLA